LLPRSDIGELEVIATLPFLIDHPYGVLSFARWALDVGAVNLEGSLLGNCRESDVAIVVEILLGHFDGEKQDSRNPRVDGVSAIDTLR
jgi:hypothetical protein